MAIQIRKAERFKSKLRLGLAGPSGSGKTMSSLKLAHGLVGDKGRILIIDTERGSGDLYAHLFNYDIISLTPPYKPQTYVDAIKAGVDAGYDVIIIDSLSHAWSDEGGLLDQADKKSASGNRFTVWAELTPQHRALVNAMLNAPCHIIATVRSKQDYAMEKDEKTGRMSVKKMGMAPVQREGMEYEFTTFMDIDMSHFAKVSKDRTDMFKDEVFLIDEKIGARFINWLNSGKENPAALVAEKKAVIWKLMKELELDPKNAAEASALIKGSTMLDLVEANYDAIIEKLKSVRDQRLKSSVKKAEAVDVKSEPVVETQAVVEKISTGQINVLKSLIEDKAGFDPNDPEAIIGFLSLTPGIRDGIKKLEDLTRGEAHAISQGLMSQESLPDEDK